jgi:hypothetical protein
LLAQAGRDRFGFSNARHASWLESRGHPDRERRRWKPGLGARWQSDSHGDDRDADTKHVGFYRIDATTGAAVKLHEEARYYGNSHSAPVTSADASTIVSYAEGVQRPPDLWVASADLADARPLTQLNPSISRIKLGESPFIDVIVYPGPFGHSDKAFRFGLDGPDGISNMQMLATRGHSGGSREAPNAKTTRALAN